jgi:hypothetical protein
MARSSDQAEKISFLADEVQELEAFLDIHTVHKSAIEASIKKLESDISDAQKGFAARLAFL